MIDGGSELEPREAGAAGALEGDQHVESRDDEARGVLRSRVDGGNDEARTREERREVRRVEGGTAGVAEAVEEVEDIGGGT